MKLMKVFTAAELGLTDDEIVCLSEYHEIPRDGYAPFNANFTPDYYWDDPLFSSINEKILATLSTEAGEDGGEIVLIYID